MTMISVPTGRPVEEKQPVSVRKVQVEGVTLLVQCWDSWRPALDGGQWERNFCINNWSKE